MKDQFYIFKLKKEDNFYKIHTGKKDLYFNYKTLCEVNSITPESMYRMDKELKTNGKFTHQHEGKILEIEIVEKGMFYKF